MTCKQWIIIESISAVLLEIIVEIILILRSMRRCLLRSRYVADAREFSVYALYTASKRLLWFILPTFAIQILVMVASLSISLPDVMAISNCAEVIFPTRIIAYR
jgi:hypothetical protein